MERILTAPKNPDEAFYLATEAISPKHAAELLCCSLTHVYRMRATGHNGEHRNDLFSQTFRFGKEMIKKGLVEALYVAVDPIVRLLGGRIIFSDTTPDKDHYHEELVDLSCAVSDLMEVSRLFLNGKSTEHQLNAAEAEAVNAVGQFAQKTRMEKK